MCGGELLYFCHKPLPIFFLIINTVFACPLLYSISAPNRIFLYFPLVCVSVKVRANKHTHIQCTPNNNITCLQSQHCFVRNIFLPEKNNQFNQTNSNRWKHQIFFHFPIKINQLDRDFSFYFILTFFWRFLKIFFQTGKFFFSKKYS